MPTNLPERPDAPDFEGRLKKALLLQGEPDRVPLMELLVEPEIIGAFLGRLPTRLEDKVEFYYRAGYDYVPMEIGLLGVGKVVSNNPYTTEAQYNLLFGVHRTRNWASEGKGMISTMDDFERFPWPSVDDLDWKSLEDLEGMLPQGMKVIVTAGKIYTPVWEWMGAQQFYYGLTDNVELIDRMFERIGSIQYATFERAISHPIVGAFWTADDIAYVKGTLVNPKYLPQRREAGRGDGRHHSHRLERHPPHRAEVHGHRRREAEVRGQALPDRQPGPGLHADPGDAGGSGGGGEAAHPRLRPRRRLLRLLQQLGDRVCAAGELQCYAGRHIHVWQVPDSGVTTHRPASFKLAGR